MKSRDVEALLALEAKTTPGEWDITESGGIAAFRKDGTSEAVGEWDMSPENEVFAIAARNAFREVAEGYLALRKAVADRHNTSARFEALLADKSAHPATIDAEGAAPWRAARVVLDDLAAKIAAEDREP